MGRGKYSPHLSHVSPNLPEDKVYIYNCYGQVPAPWSLEIKASGVEYDEKTMFDNYDNEGYDRYGYSAFDADGNYVFCGGVDRNGYTEADYLLMTDDEWEQFL